MKMLKKIMEYTSEVRLVQAKTHYMADALSRSPMFDTNDEDYTISCNHQSIDTTRDSIKGGTKSASYKALQKAVETRIFPSTIQDLGLLPVSQTN